MPEQSGLNLARSVPGGTGPGEGRAPQRRTAAAPALDSPRETSPSGRPGSGPRRVLVAVYATFALAAVARGTVQIATKFDSAPLAYVLSLLSGLIYVAATVGLMSQRRWSRPLAWAAVSVELVGVLVVGLLSVFDSGAFPHDTVWSRFGSGYFYVPLVLPIIGLLYLWRTEGRHTHSGH